MPLIQVPLTEKQTRALFEHLAIPPSAELTGELLVAAAENLALKAAGRGQQGNPLGIVIARRAAALEARRKAGFPT